MRHAYKFTLSGIYGERPSFKSSARVTAVCPHTSQYEDARSVITRGKITLTYGNQN